MRDFYWFGLLAGVAGGVFVSGAVKMNAHPATPAWWWVSIAAGLPIGWLLMRAVFAVTGTG